MGNLVPNHNTYLIALTIAYRSTGQRNTKAFQLKGVKKRKVYNTLVESEQLRGPGVNSFLSIEPILLFFK